MEILLLVIAVVALAVIMLRSGGSWARAVFLRRTGLTFMCVATALIALFVVGDAFGDPGGWPAAALAAGWLAPLAALSCLAWWRPGPATLVLAVLTAATIALAVWFALDPRWWVALETRQGPLRALASFALGLPAAVLGWRRPAAGASLLLVLGLVPVVVSAAGAGYGEAALVAVSTPPAVAGLLYVGAEFLARRAQPATPGAKPPAGSPPMGGGLGSAAPRGAVSADGHPRPAGSRPARLREWFQRPSRAHSPAHR